MSKEFWQQSFPRITAVILAICLFAFMFFDILINRNNFVDYHYWLLFSALVLILSTIASKFRFFNFIEFDSKFNEVKESSKEEFANIRQQISNSFEQQISPIQNVNTQITIDVGSLKKDVQQLSELESEEDIKNYNRGTFLKKASAIRLYAGGILQIARLFQWVIINHELGHIHDSEFSAAKKGDTNIEDFVSDEKILTWANNIIADGIEYLYPFEFEDSPDKKQELIENTKSTLDLLPSLIETYQKVERNEMQLPSFEDAQKLFMTLHAGLGDLRVSIIFLGSNSIVSNYSFHKMINTLKKELDIQTEKPN